VTLSVIGLGAAAGALKSNAIPTSGEHSTAVRTHRDGSGTAASQRLTRAELRLRERAAAAMQKRLEPLARSAARTQEHPAQQTPQAKPTQQAPPPPPQPFEVTVGTFNVLGSQHTAPGGDRTGFPPASVRSPAAAALMVKHGVDIVGTQELQTDQLNAITSRTGFAAYPGMAWGAAETDNSILYDDSRFEFVSGSKFIIPFMGRPRPQPILRLRDRATGREFYVVNTHPSAHDGRYLVERRQGEAALVGVVNQLKATGLPVLVTGDMNDREEFYCHVAPPAGLVSASGGNYASGCVPPPSPIAVDWVLGSGVTWSGYWRDTTPVTNRVSDHFFVSGTAHIG
jgi:Endonuclease/Exonuclease/phosphatase family